jgi:hypothetical protein
LTEITAVSKILRGAAYITHQAIVTYSAPFAYYVLLN